MPTVTLRKAPRHYLSIEPLVDYLEEVRAKGKYDLMTLSEIFGVNYRHLTRVVTMKNGHIEAKVPAIPLSLADQMLTHEGGETLATLWPASELDSNYRVTDRSPQRCKRCNFELLKPRKEMLCGFCIEETTGRTLAYRTREMY